MTISENEKLPDIESGNLGCNNSYAESDNIEAQSHELSTLPYPWRRYFARMLDLSLYSLIWQAFGSLILNWNIEITSVMYFINSFVPFGFMLLLEPLFLSKCGSTLGKGVFGLIVRSLEGKKLTYIQAWHRTLGVFRKGMGYHIPIFELLRVADCYSECKEHKIMPWEENLSYFIKDRKFIRIITCIVIFASILALNVLVGIEAQMPINRGAITAEKYYENCNDIMKQSKLDFGRHLNEKGKWIENKRQPEEYLAIQPLPTHQLIISDGIVTGVRIELETDNDFRTFGFSNQKEVLAMSFFAAQPKMNYIRLMRSGILKNISNSFENYTFIEDGVKVTNQVELHGYKIEDDWIVSTGREHYIHMVFTMEKI